MLFVDEMSFFERKKRLKKDINKMTISGLFFYIYGLVTLILSVLSDTNDKKKHFLFWEVFLFVFVSARTQHRLTACGQHHLAVG